jgi:hypothetical protein
MDGIVEESIETDIPGRTCSFKLTKPDVDYQAILEELAKSNSHIAGYEIM